MVLTTHYMDEAQHLADRVAVIVAGQIVAEGPPGDLAGRSGAATRIQFALPDGVVPSPTCPCPPPRSRTRASSSSRPPSPPRSLHRLTGWALDRGRAPRRAHGSTAHRSKTSTSSSPPTARTVRVVRALRIGGGRVRWEQKMYWRNPAAAGFTFAFPLMFLVVFTAINGNDKIDIPGGTVHFAQFYVPAIVAFGLISACYTNLAITLTFRREQGILKRTRGHPDPAAGLPRRAGRQRRRRLADPHRA